VHTAPVDILRSMSLSGGTHILADGSGTSPWFAIGGSCITAAAAFLGVLVAQRATRARDFDGRLWVAKSSAYVSLLRWLLRLENLLSTEGALTCPTRKELQRAALDDQLEAEVSAYGSQEVLEQLEELKWWLRRLANWAGNQRVTAFAETAEDGDSPLDR
jgi:hypothetical protein